MNRRMHFLRRLWRRPGESWLFCRIFMVTLLVPILFRMRLSFVRAILGRPVARKRPGAAATPRVVATVRAVQRIGYPLVRPGCLSRGTTLFWFLRRAGHPVHLCFGTGSPRGRFAGHCWLELDGQPFLELRAVSRDFTEIFRIPDRTGLPLPVTSAAGGSGLAIASTTPAPAPERTAVWR